VDTDVNLVLHEDLVVEEQDGGAVVAGAQQLSVLLAVVDVVVDVVCKWE
jgi:hypothetical protein